MPIVSDRNYGQILTASVAQRSKQISNIVWNATPLTRILLEEGRIRKRSAGGPELRIPVQFDKLEAQWYRGYDKLQISPKELLNSAVFPWARVVAMFSLTGDELMYNQGEEEVIDLLEFHINDAENSVKEAIEQGLVGDGTAFGGRQIVGFGGMVPILPNTGIYGGINRANVPNWRTSTFDITNGDVPGITAWDSTTALRAISNIALQRSRNSNYPDLWIFDANSWAAVEAAFVAHQRIVTRSERMERLGLPGYSYNTGAGVVDLVPAAGVGNVMPADTAFAIDTKSMAIWEFPGHDFVPFHNGQGMRPINQDAIAQGITWSGQIVLENPLFTARVITA